MSADETFSNHPETIYISSSLSLLSSLIIIFLYFAHPQLHTLFFNTFAVLTSLGVLQFAALILPFNCFWEGFLMYYVLTLNNAITMFIIWLLYAFVRYGKEEIIIDETQLQTMNSIGSVSNIDHNPVTDDVPDTTVIQSQTSIHAKKLDLSNHLSRQLAFKHQLGAVKFELTIYHKIFWYSFLIVVPLALALNGFFNDFYGPWTPWCLVMFLDERILWYHGQVYILWVYYIVMFVLVYNAMQSIKKKEQDSWQILAQKSFLFQLFFRLIFVTVSLTRCSTDYFEDPDQGKLVKQMECSPWCYFVGLLTPLSLSFVPVSQWLYIHRDMIGYLFCKKDNMCGFLNKGWWDGR